DTTYNAEANIIPMYSNVRNGDQFRLRVIPKVACPTIQTIFSPVYTARVHPSGMATIAIQTLLQPACEGLPLSVSALPFLPGSSPFYQWFQNGILIQGAIGLTLNLPEILATDSLKVRMISNAPCLINASDTIFSPTKGFSTQPNVHPVVTLLSNQPSAGTCDGVPIRFSANGLFTGPGPVYSWFVNDTLRMAGTDTVFTLNEPDNQDSIRVEMQSNALCANPTTVHSITFHPQIFPGPNLTMVFNQNELSVPGNAGWIFQWMKNGLPIVGANDSVLIISDSGHYSVALLSPENCADTTNPVFVLFSSVRNHRSSYLRVYPNPVSGVLNLESDETPDRIEVVDALGRILLQYSDSSDKKLDVSFLPPGLYNLVIHLPESIVRKNFVKTER
nr:T9SS type A sorting domain-containing protein [Catalimonadaceae bacterium]